MRTSLFQGGFAGHNTISVTPTRENYRKVEETFKSVLEATEKEKLVFLSYIFSAFDSFDESFVFYKQVCHEEISERSLL